MNESQKKFLRVFRDAKESGRTFIGFTKIRWGKDKLEISHSGNMGNTIKNLVDPNIKTIGFPSIQDLRDNFTVFAESGSPDYHWKIEFDLNKRH